MVKKLKSPRRLMALAVFAIVAMSAFGFAAANNMPNNTRAGDGDTDISGYNVTNISYGLDGSIPANIATVSFTLNHPATAANVKVAVNGTPSDSCANPLNNDFVCTMPPGVGVTGATTLYLVAAQ
ncbi:MAG: hypothetical protein AB7J35_11385 [Dehalococcoidia bacterium]